MKYRFKAGLVVFAALLSFTLLAAGGCGGGGGSSDSTSNSTGDSVPAEVTISGLVTFDSVPIGVASGLDYSATTFKPVRGAELEARLASDSSVLDSTTTGATGAYSVTIASETEVFIRVKAMSLGTGAASWEFKVVDNTSDQALYVMDSTVFNSGASDTTGKDFNASSGWDGSSYASSRVAAPFAILDTVYTAAAKVVSVDPDVSMPLLLLNWSVNNIAASGDPTLGQIGTSYFDPSANEIYLLGKEDSDTEEYDTHVIAHEWGHYLEQNFSRSDSRGGSHGAGDKLDMTVAFGEGFGNAFSAIALDDPIYLDSGGPSQSRIGVFMDVEDNSLDTESIGRFSEESVHSIIYDLYDSTDDGPDAISMGFAPIYEVLSNAQKTADSFTSIYSFISFLKQNNPSSESAINALLAFEEVSTTAVDEWDSTATETNDGGNPNSLPVYVTLSQGSSSTLCTSGEFGSSNKFMNWGYFHFEVSSSDTFTITVEPDADGDPVVGAYSKGVGIGSKDDFGDGSTETLTLNLSPGSYAGVVIEYKHFAAAYTGEECFSLTLN